MLIGSLEYQKAFFENALTKSGESISSMASALYIHQSTLRKWVKGEQQAPIIAISAVMMYLKLKSLDSDFNLMEAPTFSTLTKENIEEYKSNDDFVSFREIITNCFDIEVDDIGIYFLYQCIHNREKVVEISMSLRRDIGKETRPLKKIGPTRLINKYIEQYPDESMLSIHKATMKGSLPEIVLMVAMRHRLDCINDKYNIYLSCLKGREPFANDQKLTDLLSNFDYRSKNFSPQKFISLLGQVEREVINVNGSLNFDSSLAFTLLANQQTNFDFM